MKALQSYLCIAPEIQAQLASGAPVVALESTIISHGMPYPKNVETALNVERIIRELGATPATIAIIDGKIKVGLSAEEIDLIGRAGESVTKTSRRDLPIVLAKGEHGATTVAGTMICARLAGIQFFATGGLGGVHRDGQNSLDISADLEELAMSEVLVVCSGVKSILDIGRTLEYLETKGVAVVGYQTDKMPAFYTRESEHAVYCRMDSPIDIARCWRAKNALGLTGGLVVANPIPAAYSMDAAYIGAQIEQALEDARAAGVSGKAITPYLLERIQKITGGSSLEANIQLVYHNAALAAQIALAYQSIKP